MCIRSTFGEAPRRCYLSLKERWDGSTTPTNKHHSDVEAAPSQDIGVGLPQKGNLDLLIQKLRPIHRDAGSWEWMIVEKCAGQTISQVVETLYRSELRNGASLVDIGLWKTLFDRTVVKVVYELAQNGYINLVPDAEKMKRLRADRVNV